MCTDTTINKGEDRRKLIEQGLSRTVIALLAFNRMSRADLAERMHVPRSTVSALLGGEAKTSRRWTLPSMIQAADAFGVKLSDLIKMAEDVSGTTSQFKLSLIGTEENSEDRLGAIIRFVVGREEYTKSPGLYSPRLFKLTAPKTYMEYLKGLISDDTMRCNLSDVVHYCKKENKLLWEAIKQKIKEPEDQPSTQR